MQLGQAQSRKNPAVELGPRRQQEHTDFSDLYIYKKSCDREVHVAFNFGFPVSVQDGWEEEVTL